MTENELKNKYRGINGICRNCKSSKLATGRKSFCTCKHGYLQDQDRTSCKYFEEADHV